ncbi:DUF6415 family natural product biosynthesis protein [Streptomyces sp. NPDC048272]|uniref:DUF6415 family natural product biosynthesis protein n=1 Tax=Streptomyces sp. NPDC048272 TaxID=3154616 RepID=UPI00343CAA00
MEFRSTAPRSPAVQIGGSLTWWRRVRPAGPSRDIAASAAETVALVLGEDSPLPESAEDVVELVRRLRGHVMQLAAVAPPGPALERARDLSGADLPVDYLESRVHLRRLALATQALTAASTAQTAPMGRPAVGAAGRWRRWRPSRNTARGAVFAVAVAILIIAGSLPRK